MVKVHNASILTSFWLGLWLVLPAQAQGEDWLARYRLALRDLAVPTNVSFRQQTQISGWQAGTADLALQVRENQWQAQITEVDHARNLASSQLSPVSHKSRLAIYGVYVAHPERLAPEAVFPLEPNLAPTELREDTWNGKPAYYLAFANGVPVRELWLDPQRALPLRVHWVDAGSYGTADIFMDFGPQGSYWLPLTSLVKVQLNFWVPNGLGRRDFTGPIEIATTYRDYQFTATALPATLSTASAAQPVRPNTTPGSGLVPLKPTRDPFALSVSSDQTTSLLADRIAAFNLSKPEVVNPYTNINILLTYTWAAQRWQTYLFRFQTKEPFLPLESVTSGEQKSFPLLGN